MEQAKTTSESVESHKGTPSAPIALPPDDGRTQRERLDRSLVHGVAWIGGVKWITQILAWIATIVVARILTPADYGLVGYATVFLGIVTLLSEFGIGTTIVAMRKLTDLHVAQINTLAVLFGAVGTVVCCAVAPLLAWYFRAPELTLVVVVSSSVLFISSFRVVPQSLLQRDMRFRDLALNEGMQAVILAAGSVMFALMGFRYWTLVVSSVLSAVLSTLFAMRLVRVPLRWPDWAALGDAVRFSGQTIITRLTWYVYQNADFVAAGRLLGREALGAYSFAWNIASAPVERVTSLAGRVTPSILSAVQNDLMELRRYLLSVTEVLALIALPITIGLALVAGDLVPLVLGEKWLSAIGPLQVLAVAASVRAIAPLFAQVLMVTGANHRTMQINILAVLLMPAAFVVGSMWGLSGIAAAWLTVYPTFVVLPLALITFRRLELRPTEYLRVLGPAAMAASVMLLTVLGVRAVTPFAPSHLMAILRDVVVGGAAYVLTLFVFQRHRLRAIVSLMLRARA